MAQKHSANVERLPNNAAARAARRYIEDGRLPGGFVKHVLANDLVGAYGRADGENEASMKSWTMWLFNDIPSSAWGSEEAITEWAQKGGLNSDD